MKKCKLCLVEKELDNFYAHYQKSKSKTSDLKWLYYDPYCKTCRTNYVADRTKQVKLQCIEYLGGECLDCGLNDEHYSVYDFHHLDPTAKDFTFGKKNGLSFEKLKPELDKCVLLCANCHRKRHYTQ